MSEKSNTGAAVLSSAIATVVMAIAGYVALSKQEDKYKQLNQDFQDYKEQILTGSEPVTEKVMYERFDANGTSLGVSERTDTVALIVPMKNVLK